MSLSRDDFLQVIANAPLVSIDLIIRDAYGRVLLGRRINEPAKGMYFTPGGRIQKNECLVEALESLGRRELGLELDLASATLRGAYDHIYKSNFAEVAGIGTHYVVLGCEISMPGLQLSQLPFDQHSEWVLLPEPELMQSDEVHANVKKFFAGQSPFDRLGPALVLKQVGRRWRKHLGALQSLVKFQAELRRVTEECYYDKHPFHTQLHRGGLTKGQVQAWALNRYCFQTSVPRKDAILISRSSDRDFRREWTLRLLS